ncbi:MAG: 30S ribosomal protein S6 [Ignavibacteria bacterium]|jgi:small subunit ribosomal protein S6
MTKKIYESAVLINAALEDEQIQSVIAQIKEILSGSDSEVIEIEDWGRKRLAYTIKKSKIGYYLIFRFYALPETIFTLERFYKLDENVLRYLTIKLSRSDLEQIEKNKKPQAAAKEDDKLVPEAEEAGDEKENEAENESIDTAQTGQNS